MKKHYLDLEEEEFTSKRHQTFSAHILSASDRTSNLEISLNVCINQLNDLMSSSIPPPIRTILKIEKTSGLIYWPGTSFIVKSLTEPFVIGTAVIDKENNNTKIIPLTNDDLEVCASLNIPAKYIDVAFQGQSRLPKSMLRNELSKLYK